MGSRLPVFVGSVEDLSVGRSVVASRWIVGETVGGSVVDGLLVVGGFVIRRLQKELKHRTNNCN